MREKSIRVFLVDDQVLMRRGLRKLLEVEEGIDVVGEAADGAEALRLIPQTKPEVALVDARMPKMDGIELIRRLSEEHPRVAAIVLTTFDDDEYVFRGLKAGAKGYLLKDTPPEELVSAIEKASRDETVLGGQIAARVISELRRMTDSLERTPRPEDDVLSGRRWRSRSSWARALPTGRYPSPLHHRRNRQEPHLEDPQEAGSQGSHPTSALRRRTGMDEARPIAGTSISRSGLMLPDGLRTGPHYEIAGV